MEDGRRLASTRRFNCHKRGKLKTGDEVKFKDKPEWGVGKVIRFYAYQSTVLVDFSKKDNLTYCDYASLEKK